MLVGVALVLEGDVDVADDDADEDGDAPAL